MIYYVTKYALANDGKLLTLDSEATPDAQGYVRLRQSASEWTMLYKLGRDVFTDEAAAEAALLKARDKKIASLEKQIAKLSQIGGAA